METRELICISCPVGCILTARINGDDVDISGNNCGAGDRYGVQECKDPRRMLTTSIPVVDKDSSCYMLSVKTTDTIPKGKIFDCLYEIKALTLNGDYYIGDVIIENILGLNVDVIATRGKEKEVMSI